MVDLTLVQLRMLHELARQGTMSAAATALGYTPSAISQQLAQLERSAGTELFERVGRNVHLTDAGFELAERAERILSEVEAAGAALESSHNEVRGEIHVGLFESVAASLLPRMLTRLHDLHPDLEVRTRLAEPGAAIDALLAGELDLAFTLQYDAAPTTSNDRLASDTVYDDVFHLVVPANDPIEGGTVSLTDVTDRPFIGSDPGSPCGRLLNAACATLDVRLDTVHCFDDYRTVMTLVAAGHGVALIPELGLCDVPSGVRVIRLAEPISRRVVLTYRNVSADRPAVRAVRQALCELLDETQPAA